MDGEQAHRERVEQIAAVVNEARERGEKPRIVHGSSHSVRPGDDEADAAIHVEALHHFIEVDEEEQTVRMEPDITMRELVNKTLEHGLIPHVVPEFPTITVGGAIQGGAGESSCFRYGLFGDHCTEFEIVTGDGEVVTATREQHEDLFHGAMGSYGSLGILTEVSMDLLPAKDYVKLTYITVNGFEDAIRVMEEECESGADFIDGIMFSRDRGVIMVGKLTEEEDLPVSRFSRARDEWFYLHADSISRNHARYEELIPIKEYFFRYDIGAFWAIKYGFEDMHIPFNRLTRTVLHPFMNTAIAYKGGIHAGNFSSEYIIQDIITRQEDTLEMLEWTHDNLGIYPLWLLPLKPEEDAKLAPSYLETDLAINIGIWGRPQRDGIPREQKQQLEDKQIAVGARKTLYAQQFYTENEFWSIYDHDWYQELRDRYDATDAFPSVYEITHVDTLPEPSIRKSFRAMVKATFLS